MPLAVTPMGPLNFTLVRQLHMYYYAISHYATRDSSETIIMKTETYMDYQFIRFDIREINLSTSDISDMLRINPFLEK